MVNSLHQLHYHLIYSQNYCALLGGDGCFHSQMHSKNELNMAHSKNELYTVKIIVLYLVRNVGFPILCVARSNQFTLYPTFGYL
jgi:hypothetical protein